MPLEIDGLGKRVLRLTWDDDAVDEWAVKELRIACTCAHCQSEVTGERLLDPSTVADSINIAAMSLVGNYGLSVQFSDGHATGIYRFRELDRRTRKAHR